MYHFYREGYEDFMDLLVSWRRGEDKKGNKIYVPIKIIDIRVVPEVIREEPRVTVKEIKVYIEVSLGDSSWEIDALCHPAAHPNDKAFVAQLKEWDFECYDKNGTMTLKTWSLGHTDLSLRGDQACADYSAICDFIEQINREKYSKEAIKVVRLNSGKSSGCYIATAVYGSYDCPQVLVLRRFRDEKLLRTWYGKIFVNIYYAVSPTIVKLFGETDWFNRFWKTRLDGMIQQLKNKGFADTPYMDE